VPGLGVDSGAVSLGILGLEMQGLVSSWHDLTAQPTCWNAKGNRFREGVRVPTASKVPATESEIPALSNLISATHLLQSFFATSPRDPAPARRHHTLPRLRLTFDADGILLTSVDIGREPNSWPTRP